ncbi:MAG: OsmC family protein [Gemmatimonadota bacterium]
MTPEELRALQAPLKQRYRTEPAAALVTSAAVATLDQGRIACRVESPQPGADVGLHPAAGGDGTLRCSGDMLVEALAGCAGVTLLAVATAMGITIRTGTIRAEGDWDARGTLGVSKEVPVGCTAIRLRVKIDTDAKAEQIAKLLELTERYCVVAQTLAAGVKVEVG